MQSVALGNETQGWDSGQPPHHMALHTERVRGEPAWEFRREWQDWPRDQCSEQEGIQESRL